MQAGRLRGPVWTQDIGRFAHDVNWNAPNWKQQAGDLWRTLLAANAAAYLANGTLGDYRNKATPLDVADEFKILFEAFAEFEKLSPEFFDHLKRFPAARLEEAQRTVVLEQGRHQSTGHAHHAPVALPCPARCPSSWPDRDQTDLRRALLRCRHRAHRGVRRWAVGVLYGIDEPRSDQIVDRILPDAGSINRPAPQPRLDGRNSSIDEERVRNSSWLPAAGCWRLAAGGWRLAKRLKSKEAAHEVAADLSFLPFAFFLLDELQLA